MKLSHRRQFLHLAASAAALPAVARIARAQTYPTRPVRIIVGFPPGQTGDISARLLGQWLSDRLGQSFVIENRPGAGGNLALQAVARAPADGYTLLLWLRHTPSTYRSIPIIRRASRHRSDCESQPRYVRSADQPLCASQHGSGIHCLREGQSGQDQPGFERNRKLTHLAGELFKTVTGIDAQHVPYRGSPAALADLTAGDVQALFDTDVIPADFKAGQIRALACRPQHAFALPNVQTIAETVPGYDASQDGLVSARRRARQRRSFSGSTSEINAAWPILM